VNGERTRKTALLHASRCQAKDPVARQRRRMSVPRCQAGVYWVIKDAKNRTSTVTEAAGIFFG